MAANAMDANAYIAQLNPMEQKILQIARSHLETSFSLDKSIGFQEWQKAQKEQTKQQEPQAQPMQVQIQEPQQQAEPQQEPIKAKKPLIKRKIIIKLKPS
jgi:hypothetical protein